MQFDNQVMLNHVYNLTTTRSEQAKLLLAQFVHYERNEITQLQLMNHVIAHHAHGDSETDMLRFYFGKSMVAAGQDVELRFITGRGVMTTRRANGYRCLSRQDRRNIRAKIWGFGYLDHNGQVQTVFRSGQFVADVMTRKRQQRFTKSQAVRLFF